MWLLQYIRQAEIENVSLRPGQLLEVYTAFAVSGHTEHLTEVGELPAFGLGNVCIHGETFSFSTISEISVWNEWLLTFSPFEFAFEAKVTVSIKKKKKIKGQLANAVVKDWLLVEAGWGIFFQFFQVHLLCFHVHSTLLIVVHIKDPASTFDKTRPNGGLPGSTHIMYNCNRTLQLMKMATPDGR